MSKWPNVIGSKDPGQTARFMTHTLAIDGALIHSLAGNYRKKYLPRHSFSRVLG